MELKKSPKADLENKRGLFFEIGLAISLLFMIGAFAWSQEEKVVQTLTAPVEVVETEMVEITVQDETPMPIVPAKQTLTVTSDIIKIVSNDTKIKTDFDFSQDIDDESVVVTTIKKGIPGKVGMEVGNEDNEPFVIAEDMPGFMGGGLEKFHAWVKSKVQYPVLAQESGIQGRVIISFVVEKNGTVGRIQVMSSPDPSLSDEAVRVIKSSPKWVPAKQRGVPVPLKFNIPVDFRLQ